MIFLKDFFLCCMLMISCCKIKATRVIGQSTTATAGNNASMFCQLVETKEKLTRITWQKRTRGTPINKDFFVITPDGKAEKKNGLGDRTEFIGNIGKINGTVLLKDVLLLDEGVYTCIFNIFPSGPFEKEIDLHVQVPPIVSVTTDVIPVVVESEVTLATCTASKALPAAEVSWRLGALNNSVTVKTIHYEDLDRTFTVKSFLIGVPSKDLNQQKVQCLVKHICLNEEVTLDYTLVIHYPPQVVYIILVNVTATSHDFQCVVDASPQPTEFIWSRINETFSNWADHDRLIIPLTSDNNGLYMCNVSNTYGNGTGTLYVHAFRAGATVCWSLFGTLTLFLIIAIFLMWRYNVAQILVRLTERIGHSEENTMTSDLSITTSNHHQNHRNYSKVKQETLSGQS